MLNLSRRAFLRGLTGTVAAATVAAATVAPVVAPSLLSRAWSAIYAFFTHRRVSPNLDKELIITRALESEEALSALSQSMVEPLRRALEYQAIGRKIFMVDELPPSALARYERDCQSVADHLNNTTSLQIQQMQNELTQNVVEIEHRLAA